MDFQNDIECETATRPALVVDTAIGIAGNGDARPVPAIGDRHAVDRLPLVVGVRRSDREPTVRPHRTTITYRDVQINRLDSRRNTKHRVEIEQCLPNRAPGVAVPSGAGQRRRQWPVDVAGVGGAAAVRLQVAFVLDAVGGWVCIRANVQPALGADVARCPDLTVGGSVVDVADGYPATDGKVATANTTIDPAGPEHAAVVDRYARVVELDVRGARIGYEDNHRCALAAAGRDHVHLRSFPCRSGSHERAAQVSDTTKGRDLAAAIIL